MNRHFFDRDQHSRWQDVLITDERLDAVYVKCDRWSRIMACVACLAAIFVIILPAIFVLIDGQNTEPQNRRHGTIMEQNDGSVMVEHAAMIENRPLAYSERKDRPDRIVFPRGEER